ncbi:hypothetical protein DXV76_07965 [Rhodobacteraceae bacterium CCMM004]|nr:hypothetical protein DXV76_07965 [Rhodobacteraceae bacterium CCMM004]
MDAILAIVAIWLAFGHAIPAPQAETAAPADAAAPVPDVPGGTPAASLPAAEDQTPTGRFTTAGEVRPILMATRPQWVGVRSYGGQDLVYFTNLLAWRCGLAQIAYAVNGGAMQVLDTEPCHLDTATPNALRLEGVLPYVAFPPGSVERVEVQVTFDDLSIAAGSYARPEIAMP